MQNPKYDVILILEEMGACYQGMSWVERQKHPTFHSMWGACPRGDWMLWLTGQCCPFSMNVAAALYDFPMHLIKSAPHRKVISVAFAYLRLLAARGDLPTPKMPDAVNTNMRTMQTTMDSLVLDLSERSDLSTMVRGAVGAVQGYVAFVDDLTAITGLEAYLHGGKRHPSGLNLGDRAWERRVLSNRADIVRKILPSYVVEAHMLRWVEQQGYDLAEFAYPPEKENA